MTTEKEYLQNMELDKEAYRIGVTEFKQWLKDFNLTDKFYRMLTTESVWFIATDFSIPVIMVKYFKKMA